MPRRKIDGTLRQKYGLPQNALGKHWNKDAVTFYNVFCVPNWESSDPLEFVILRKDFLAFGIVRERIKSIPRGVSDGLMRAFLIEQSADLTVFRLGINKAACSKSLQEVIDWPFQIVKHKTGVSYAVQSVEARVSNGVDAVAILGFANAKKRHVQLCYSAIKPEKHTAEEMADLYMKSEFDDSMFDDLDKAIAKMRQRVDASENVRRLQHWALKEKWTD